MAMKTRDERGEIDAKNKVVEVKKLPLWSSEFEN